MDNLYGSSSRPGKMTPLNGNVPVNAGMYSHPSMARSRHKPFPKTPTADQYSFMYNNLVKYLQSSSPPSVFGNIGPMTPVKLNMEEETLMVDITPVQSSSGGSSSGNSHSRRPVYRAVEDNIGSFSGFKSRLIRGREEKTPPRFSIKTNLSEAVTGIAAELEAPKYVAALLSRPALALRPPGIKIPFRDWSPLDDEILVASPSQTGKAPSRKDVDMYIDRFLYGPRTTRRLPVFTEITDQ